MWKRGWFLIILSIQPFLCQKADANLQNHVFHNDKLIINDLFFDKVQHISHFVIFFGVQTFKLLIIFLQADS